MKVVSCIGGSAVVGLCKGACIVLTTMTLASSSTPHTLPQPGMCDVPHALLHPEALARQLALSFLPLHQSTPNIHLIRPPIQPAHAPHHPTPPTPTHLS